VAYLETRFTFYRPILTNFVWIRYDKILMAAKCDNLSV